MRKTRPPNSFYGIYGIFFCHILFIERPRINAENVGNFFFFSFEVSVATFQIIGKFEWFWRPFQNRYQLDLVINRRC